MTTYKLFIRHAPDYDREGVLCTASEEKHGSQESALKYLEEQRDRWISNGPSEYGSASYEIRPDGY
jgi:hypothetical protein